MTGHEASVMQAVKFGDDDVRLRLVKQPEGGLILDWTKPSPNGKEPFPQLLGGWESLAILTLRELAMLLFIEQITNKPEWNKKVLNHDILAKWDEEVMNINWADSGIEGAEWVPTEAMFSWQMFGYCVQELQEKARAFEKTGLINVFDVEERVVKSDTAIPPELKRDLKEAVAGLENVPEADKDWHPGSDGKVLDLVHPSLWPLVFGKSRILRDKVLDLENCLESCGTGEILHKIRLPMRESQLSSVSWSRKFQWLPCDVEFPDGKNAKIVSYINNLHPKQHTALYGAIEQLITKAVPLWHIVWKGVVCGDKIRRHRIRCSEVRLSCLAKDICGDRDCYDGNRPLDPDETEDTRDDARDEAWFAETHLAEQPEPEKYRPGDPTVIFSPDDISGEAGLLHFANNKLQVIVKLANIQLTPEKPSYDGGSWHTEGQLNEKICATAVYYYDNENVTDSYLGFKVALSEETFADEVFYEQGDEEGIRAVFGFENYTNAIQTRGRVLTREDRLIAFPNVLQHRVSPFRLVDPTRPGHRKIVALFLVDPASRILSTANVPPQQKDWWLREVVPTGRLGPRFPVEISSLILNEVDSLIDLDEAKALRKELMAERSAIFPASGEGYANQEWNFCEH